MLKFLYQLNQKRLELKHSIRNTIRLLPVIWRFRPWDFSYSTDLFKASLVLLLEDMRRIVKEDGSQKALATTILLLERYKKEEYEIEETDLVDKKYGRSTDSSDLYFLPNEKGHFVMRSRFEDSTAPEVYAQYRKDMRRAYDRATRRQQQDLSLALHYIKKYNRRWWS